MTGAALPVGGMAAARSLAASGATSAPVALGGGGRCTVCGAPLRRFGVIDPGSPPGVCRVTTGSTCPDCSLVEADGAVVHRIAPDALELVDEDWWRDLGAGDA